MDVTKSYLLILSLLITSCNSGESNNQMFREPTPQCADSAVKNSFLVKFKSGEIKQLEKDKDQVSQWIDDSKNQDEIEVVENNYKVSVFDNVVSLAATGDPTWGVADVNVSSVWSEGVWGQNTVIGIIDSGIDYDHPQLANRLAKNYAELNGKIGVDDDSNGYIDDFLSWNFASNTSDVADHLGHGTHVAGIIAAEHTSTIGSVKGIAPSATVLPISFIDSSGSGYISDAIRSIDYAISRRVNIINASWGGGGCSSILQEKINSLAANGILFISASGNAGNNIDRILEYPASLNLKNQITVGAVDSNGFITSFSNYGLINVHLLAPGSNILSTYPSSTTHALSGTSMATPFVAAATALLKSYRPSADYSLIKQALIASATNYDYPVQSQGKLNIGAAYQWLKSH